MDGEASRTEYMFRPNGETIHVDCMFSLKSDTKALAQELSCYYEMYLQSINIPSTRSMRNATCNHNITERINSIHSHYYQICWKLPVVVLFIPD